MEHFVQTILNGLTTGALYCCIAVGFTLIFGIIQLIYFAQCEMAMVGAFSFAGAYLFLHSMLPFPLAIVLSAIFACSCSIIITCLGQRLLLHPLRNTSKVKGLIVSLGFSVVLQNIVFLWISSDNQLFPVQSETKWMNGGIAVTSSQLIVIAGSLATWFLVWGLLSYTRLGRSIRAVAESRDGALLMGINVDRTITITFAIAAVTATIAGILMGVYNGQMRFDMGFVPGIKGFTAAILGGVGNIRGALLAGIFLGVAEGLFAGYLSSDYRDVFAFVLLILVLLVRPHGLLGEGS